MTKPGFEVSLVAAGRTSRRAWLGRAAGGVVAGVMATRHRSLRAEGPGPVAMIVRNARPLDLETPVTALDSWLTPADAFFVRSHFGEPADGLSPWRVQVGGLIERPLSLGLEDLDHGEFRRESVVAVLQCSGNGRAFFRPRVAGVGWERGAVGQGEWAGARLADVLVHAGLKRGARHVHFLGADGPPSPRTPLYLRSIPLEKAMQVGTLLATTMNGAPLPVEHGGPLRLAVPGWAGNHWMKWVRWITVAAEEAPGFYMQTAYRLPKSPTAPDAAPRPSDLVPVAALNVKSLITWPAEGTTLDQGRHHEIRGIAWTGEGVVTGVDVSVAPPGAANEWRPATLEGEPRPWCWRPWRISFVARTTAPIVVRARATDSRGQTQPEETPWNRSGYLWNGIDRVSCKVG